MIKQYNMYCTDPNNIGYWFPKLHEGEIKLPETKIFKVPFHVYEAMWMLGDDDDAFKEIKKYVDRDVVPHMGWERYFVKNGTFSNKFDFSKTLTDSTCIACSVASINYAAMCLGAGGYTEIALRQIIPHEPQLVPHIYNGLPLRPEVRSFYDFDERRLLYSVNYWDPKYIENRLYDLTDKIIFNHEKDNIAAGFENNVNQIEALLEEQLADVKLTGKWSVDVLVDGDKYWLIDMAKAENSAYWRNM
jgi:hypothetical protein